MTNASSKKHNESSKFKVNQTVIPGGVLCVMSSMNSLNMTERDEAPIYEHVRADNGIGNSSSNISSSRQDDSNRIAKVPVLSMDHLS